MKAPGIDFVIIMFGRFERLLGFKADFGESKLGGEEVVSSLRVIA